MIPSQLLAWSFGSELQSFATQLRLSQEITTWNIWWNQVMLATKNETRWHLRIAERTILLTTVLVTNEGLASERSCVEHTLLQ